MGLDQWVAIGIYVVNGNGNKRLMNSLKKYFPQFKIESAEITLNIAYWRKANHIHAWFVKHVQNGKDNCKKHAVELSELQKLKSTCEIVLKHRSKASELLPRTAGFFFGSTTYDKWYFDDVKYTIEIIDNLNKFIEENKKTDKFWISEITYNSSW